MGLLRGEKMNSHFQFPRELNFLRIVFGLGAGVGLFLLIIGLLGLFVGNVLKVFSGDPGSLVWTLNFLAFGVLGTTASIRVLQLLRVPEPSSPPLIVMWAWWLVVGEIILSLIVSIQSGAFFEFTFNHIQNLALWLFFYVWTSSQFRLLTVVRDYYGAVAPPSRLGWINQLEGWILRAIKPGQERKSLESQIED